MANPRAPSRTALFGAVLLVGTIESAVFAQTSRPAPTSSPATAPDTTHERRAPRTSDPRPIVRRAPLLREGSNLVEVVGRLARDPNLGWWTFTIDDSDPLSPSHELAMLPNSMLDEMDRLVASVEDRQLVFEMTGEVFVYRGHNFLLATHPPVLIAHEPSEEPTTAPVAAPSNAAGSAEGDAAEDIIRELRQAAGTVARRAAPAPAPDADDRSKAPVRAGSLLVDRRGKVRRTPTGAYLFLFDADAHGNADPPLMLLPCLMLERLDSFARREGGAATVLLSGHVSEYRGRNYLRPTVYRIPRERTILRP